MILFKRLTSIIVLLAMVGAWCLPCMDAMQAVSSCCSQPCDSCACGFEAMPADMDSARVAVVASPLSLDPVVFTTTEPVTSSHLTHLASCGRTHGTDLASPPSSSDRLSLLSVYLI